MITDSQRRKAEALIYRVMDALDKTRTNSDAYKVKFASMSNAQFEKYISGNFPYRFYQKPFEIEPTMSDAFRACEKVLGVPVMEQISMPHLYEDENGVPVETVEPQFTGYIPLEKMQQFLTHKNSMSTSIDNRNMKTGELLSQDRNGKSTDREIQGFVTLGMDKTCEEFSKSRADAMESKNKMAQEISARGRVSLDDISTQRGDSLSRTITDVYLIGANIHSNIVSDDYYLPYNQKHTQERKVRTV